MKSILQLFRTVWKPIGTLLAFLQRVILFTLVYLIAGPIAFASFHLRGKSRGARTFWMKKPERPRDHFLRQY